MSLTSRHLLTDAINYFYRVMTEHEKVDSVELIEKDTYKAIFEIFLTDGRLLVTYIGDVYVLTAADVREIVSEYEGIDCIVVVSNWEHYTSDAKDVAKGMRVGVFTLKEFMKAINYNGRRFLDTGMGQENSIVIYDTTIAKPVLYEEYYNEDKEEWRFKVKLKTDHHYCAFRAFSIRERVTNEEIGECFLYGLYDFPQNTINAIKYFEKADSTEGYFQIGKILMEDEELKDEIEALQFIKKAAEMGSEDANDYLTQRVCKKLP